jgi:hypothetical protein
LRQISKRREPTHAASHHFSLFLASLPFRLPADFAGADAASEERPAECASKHTGKNWMFHDGSIIVRGSCREDTADRYGVVADGRELAAADG